MKAQTPMHKIYRLRRSFELYPYVTTSNWSQHSVLILPFLSSESCLLIASCSDGFANNHQDYERSQKSKNESS